MDTPAYDATRSAVQVDTRPGLSSELTGVETRLRALLTESGLFEQVEVGQTDDPDQLVIALCTFGLESDEGDIAQRLEDIWSDEVRYPFWEAHSVDTEEGLVELEATSRTSAGGHYVTVHVVAQQARVPRQRTHRG